MLAAQGEVDPRQRIALRPLQRDPRAPRQPARVMGVDRQALVVPARRLHQIAGQPRGIGAGGAIAGIAATRAFVRGERGKRGLGRIGLGLRDRQVDRKGQVAWREPGGGGEALRRKPVLAAPHCEIARAVVQRRLVRVLAKALRNDPLGLVLRAALLRRNRALVPLAR